MIKCTDLFFRTGIADIWRLIFTVAFKGLKQGTEELGIFFITPVADVKTVGRSGTAGNDWIAAMYTTILVVDADITFFRIPFSTAALPVKAYLFGNR